jgi:wyosine [tRNA(Phe)-imidazoG37] synthetase (radical SAM superfamily)
MNPTDVDRVTPMSHVFGPVPSRRLGRSLGIDLIPFKSCTFDCLYCQLGTTEEQTLEKQESVGVDEVMAELVEKLSAEPDYITLSGSGEPTLYRRIGELIERIHGATRIPVAVITNGSLLWDDTVRMGLKDADLVIPSLDAGDEEMYRRVNRPHADISFARLVDGLITFRKEYSGRYWLEVLLLAGLTDSRSEAAKIAAIARRIGPDRIQLNTCVRPPADQSAHMVERDRLIGLSRLFEPQAEVIADFRDDGVKGSFKAGTEEITEMLSRRPCSALDIALGLGLPLNAVIKDLKALLAQGRVEAMRTEGGQTHYVMEKTK